jgi:hypothetical protein
LLHPILPPDDDKMDSGVIMAEDDDDIEIIGPKDVSSKEEKDESWSLLVMRTEERSLTMTQRTTCSLAYHLANVLELVFC